MDIKKAEPIMPVLPEMFMNAMPVQVPQMKWETGFLADFFHNWKLGRIEKASEREARIAENKMKLVNATLTMMQDLMTFSSETELRFKKVEHEKQMMNIYKDKAQAELAQIQLKNLLLQGEVKLNEIELKVKMKELEEILNGTSKT